ncbi:MAG TPA: flavodoxin domain-containing protein [Jatrophihabitantaceae bacterium]
MRALVVYESMYGNTRTVADAIAAGLAETWEVRVVRVGEVTPELLEELDLLVVGGPTHVWSLSRPNTRRSAVQAAQKPDSTLRVEPGAAEPGLREWLSSLEPHTDATAAAFDTRMPGPAIFTGRASKAIARRLRRLGYRLAVAPQSFQVSRANELLPGEAAHAQAWAEQIASVARVV